MSESFFVFLRRLMDEDGLKGEMSESSVAEERVEVGTIWEEGEGSI